MSLVEHHSWSSPIVQERMGEIAKHDSELQEMVDRVRVNPPPPTYFPPSPPPAYSRLDSKSETHSPQSESSWGKRFSCWPIK